MDDRQAIREHPVCSSAEVPRLVMRVGRSESMRLNWRGRLRLYEWSHTNRSRDQFRIGRIWFEPFRVCDPLGSRTQTIVVPREADG